MRGRCCLKQVAREGLSDRAFEQKLKRGKSLSYERGEFTKDF